LTNVCLIVIIYKQTSFKGGKGNTKCVNTGKARGKNEKMCCNTPKNIRENGKGGGKMDPDVTPLPFSGPHVLT
jgi:hypothetical protein